MTRESQERKIKNTIEGKNEEQGTKYGALRHSGGDGSKIRRGPIDNNKLMSIREVGTEPRQEQSSNVSVTQA